MVKNENENMVKAENSIDENSKNNLSLYIHFNNLLKCIICIDASYHLIPEVYPIVPLLILLFIPVSNLNNFAKLPFILLKNQYGLLGRFLMIEFIFLVIEGILMIFYSFFYLIGLLCPILWIVVLIFCSYLKFTGKFLILRIFGIIFTLGGFFINLFPFFDNLLFNKVFTILSWFIGFPLTLTFLINKKN